ncbi:MAG: ATP-binding protein, partial [Coriobacteriia bacterium]|nr:ATP-binding protein [Coriobacteriia bacterium]
RPTSHTGSTSEDLKLLEYDSDIAHKTGGLSGPGLIGAKENVILAGNPGRGKTHLAIGLGVAACQKDMRAPSADVPNLVTGLKEAMSRSEVTAYKRKFANFELVIVDELGYVSFDKEGNEILFEPAFQPKRHRLDDRDYEPGV